MDAKEALKNRTKGKNEFSFAELLDVRKGGNVRKGK